MKLLFFVVCFVLENAHGQLIAAFAGNGTAGNGGNGGLAVYAYMRAPKGVAVDTATGRVYISDTDNMVVRAVDPVTRVISTVAGQGFEGYAGDGGLATSALLSSPCGLAFAAQTLYIADSMNGRIRAVATQTGLIRTVTSGLSLPVYGVAVSPSGEIYVADSAAYRVCRVSSDGGCPTVVGTGSDSRGADNVAATASAIGFVLGLTFDVWGNLIVAENSNCRVRNVSATTGLIRTVAGSGTCSSGPDGPALMTTIQPGDVAFDAYSGRLFISDSSDNRVRALTPGGMLLTLAGNRTAGRTGDGGLAALAALNAPGALAAGANSSLYLCDRLNNRVRLVTGLDGRFATTGIVTTSTGTTSTGTTSTGTTSTGTTSTGTTSTGTTSTGTTSTGTTSTGTTSTGTTSTGTTSTGTTSTGTTSTGTTSTGTTSTGTTSTGTTSTGTTSTGTTSTGTSSTGTSSTGTTSTGTTSTGTTSTGTTSTGTTSTGTTSTGTTSTGTTSTGTSSTGTTSTGSTSTGTTSTGTTSTGTTSPGATTGRLPPGFGTTGIPAGTGSQPYSCQAQQNYVVNYQGSKLFEIFGHNRTCSCGSFSGNGAPLVLTENPTISYLLETVARLEAMIVALNATVHDCRANCTGR